MSAHTFAFVYRFLYPHSHGDFYFNQSIKVNKKEYSTQHTQCEREKGMVLQI